jgi:hypothetical protein
MRPERFQQLLIHLLPKAPDVQHVEAWQEGAARPHGVVVTFTSGSRLWAAVSSQLPPGQKGDAADVPVTGEPPAEVSVPPLFEGGKVSPVRAEAYLAATLNNSRHEEIARAYGYSEGATATRPTAHPGVGVTFHSGGRGFALFVHTARPGQERGGRGLDLQSQF